ncbi:MAG: hypothetical protein R3F59_26995 [Myxococcota bacterium]
MRTLPWLLLAGCPWITPGQQAERLAALGACRERDAFVAFVDADGDGAGDPTRYDLVCALSPGWSATADDCDDADPDAYPGAVWAPDGDGDGAGDASAPLTSCGRPGAGYVAGADDCDDDDPAIPGPEVCGGGDEDCDGEVDEADAIGAATWYRDADGDHLGDPTQPLSSCAPPGPGWVDQAGDCDDADPRVPDDVDLCDDGVDNDCDGTVDGPDCWRDTDGDGIPDDEDLCPELADQGTADRDDDGVGDRCDNCDHDYNPDQADADGDGRGDVCDRD